MAIAALGCGSVPAQSQAGPAAAPGTATSGTAASGMRLNLFVNGSGADALRQGDLTLLDNGTPVPVQSLLPPHAGNVPTHVILVIDDVNARATTVAYERSELKKFLTRNDGQLRVPLTIAVMTDTKMDIQPGFSQDGNAINQALQKYPIGLHEIRRDSQYGGQDRTNICLGSLRQLVQYASTIPGHKLILFLSPGWPLLSGPRIQLTAKEQRGIYQSVAELQDSMLQADITLDMLNPFGPNESVGRSDYYQAFLKSAKKPGDVDIADLSLQVLATHNGGEVQQGSNDIDRMVDHALSEMDSRYTVSFTPAPAEAPNGFHSLKAQVNRPGVTVRMPDEYYTRQAVAEENSR
ncbi:VWA domain-containing protein [Terriglobus aquaticus]|uniref:VWA domain-containing protein n=1 Tax=Terriglobus aquaticus TaxID=940139 RepID=A0ABW9KJD3_9BACT|nr:VWA domain-containing protein [Terriglobus aquaticus]